MPFICLIIW